MGNTWVLVADGKRARLFEYGPEQEAWVEIACLVNPEGTQGPARQRPMRVQESVGQARHAIEPHTRPRDKQLSRFAAMLVRELREAHDKRRFEKLAIVAAPRLLGLLHGQLDKGLGQCLTCEVRHNLVALHSEEIRRYLPGHLSA